MSAAERLRDLPDDALDRRVMVEMSVRELLTWQSRRADEPAFDGTPTAQASDITGIPPRKLRRRHATWERMQERGETPPIRVSRKGDSDRSDKLFDRGDCYRWRRENGGAVRVVETEAVSEEPNEARAIARRLLRQG